MASTSGSLGMNDVLLEVEERDDPQLNPNHSIFLSHSGAQKPFAEQLNEDLKRCGQVPFFDQNPDCLPKGEEFAKRIFKAARECEVAVVVLSKEFLESRWPMLELAAFVEAQQTTNPELKLFPLFYKLEVSSLKEPNISRVAELWRGMADADMRFRAETKIFPDKWKAAVQVLARANGEVFSMYGGSEVKYRNAIVDAVCKLCRPNTNRLPSMVGKKRLCNVMEGEFDKLAAKEGVAQVGARILGLYGRGGVGKTFICKALCDHFSDEYDGRVCYVEYSDGTYLELLKLILEELTDIDKRALRKIRSENQADDLLKWFLPKQDVFLALDNLQDDHLDWPLLTYLSTKSKAVVASRSMANVVRVVGSSPGVCLPCPSLTESDALKLFLQSAGCAQPSVKWTNEEMEILKSCIELSFFEEINELNDSCERRGQHNPLVLVAMGTTIKGKYALEPMQLMEKCQRIKFLPQHAQRRSLSDILRTEWLDLTGDDLTGDEKVLFLDVALLYTVTNLGDVELVDVLDRVLKWLETVDGGPRSEILLKLKNLNDLNDSALNDHRKEHEVFQNIYLALTTEGARRMDSGNDMSGLPYISKAVEILELHKVSIEARASLGVMKLHGCLYMFRGDARLKARDFSGGIEDLVKADEFYPNHANILFLLGVARYGIGQWQEALVLLNRAIALFPETEEGVQHAQKYAYAFVLRSHVKFMVDDTAGAKLDLDFARKLGVDSPDVDGLEITYQKRIVRK